MRFLIILIFSVTLSGAAGAQAPSQALHAPWDRLLDAHVEPGPEGVNRVDYAAWRADAADRNALEAYIETLEAQRVSDFGEDAAFAYWANLYNAVTVRLILDEAPERSIRQIRPHLFAIGPWGVERVTVEGEALSLDDIEHEIMRERFEAAMVHYAVNCASIGCPNLKRTAWRAEGLQAALDAAARAYINHPRGVTVTGDGLVVSRIYKWFREDFGGSQAGVIDHLLDYAEPGLAEEIRANPHIDGHAYDWSLNRPD